MPEYARRQTVHAEWQTHVPRQLTWFSIWHVYKMHSPRPKVH